MRKLVFVVVILLSLVMISAEQEVVIKDTNPFWYASMAFKGSFQQMQVNINQFMQEYFGQGLAIMGPGVSLYHNSPLEVKEAELEWEFGFTVAEDTVVKEPLKKTQVKGAKAAVYMHIGPYEGLPQAWEKVNKWITEQGYEAVYPVYDRYLNNPMLVKPEELKTQIVVPVKKK